MRRQMRLQDADVERIDREAKMIHVAPALCGVRCRRRAAHLAQPSFHIDKIDQRRARPQLIEANRVSLPFERAAQHILVKSKRTGDGTHPDNDMVNGLELKGGVLGHIFASVC